MRALVAKIRIAMAAAEALPTLPLQVLVGLAAVAVVASATQTKAVAAVAKGAAAVTALIVASVVVAQAAAAVAGQGEWRGVSKRKANLLLSSKKTQQVSWLDPGYPRAFTWTLHCTRQPRRSCTTRPPLSPPLQTWQPTLSPLGHPRRHTAPEFFSSNSS